MQVEQLRFDGKVLVAEDNPVNEEVAREFLTGFGCEVHVARNGIEAVGAFESGGFDIVFMDCQMPMLDGLAATRRIRDIERASGPRRLPIIALTANAFDADRQACLDAGMDGYISKPFSEEQIGEMLAAWLTPTVNDSDGDCLDEATVAKLAQRAALLRRLVDIYLSHAPVMIANLRAACAQGDSAAAKLASHSLKSSSANVGALRLSALAREIEILSAADDVLKAANQIEALHRHFACVERALRKLVAAPPAPVADRPRDSAAA